MKQWPLAPVATRCRHFPDFAAAPAVLCKQVALISDSGSLGLDPSSAAEQTPLTSEDDRLAAQWDRVRGRLQADVGEVEYRTWLRQMTLGGVDGDEVTLHLPTRFLRDWVRGHYADKLNALWQAENHRVRRVDIRVGTLAPRGSGTEPALEGLADLGPTRPDGRPDGRPD